MKEKTIGQWPETVIYFEIKLASVIFPDVDRSICQFSLFSWYRHLFLHQQQVHQHLQEVAFSLLSLGHFKVFCCSGVTFNIVVSTPAVDRVVTPPAFPLLVTECGPDSVRGICGCCCGRRPCGQPYIIILMWFDHSATPDIWFIALGAFFWNS